MGAQKWLLSDAARISADRFRQNFMGNFYIFPKNTFTVWKFILSSMHYYYADCSTDHCYPYNLYNIGTTTGDVTLTMEPCKLARQNL